MSQWPSFGKIKVSKFATKLFLHHLIIDLQNKFQHHQTCRCLRLFHFMSNVTCFQCTFLLHIHTIDFKAAVFVYNLLTPLNQSQTFFICMFISHKGVTSTCLSKLLLFQGSLMVIMNFVKFLRSIVIFMYFSFSSLLLTQMIWNSFSPTRVAHIIFIKWDG